MDKFINKLNFDFAINQQILKLIGNIDVFKGKWNISEKQENNYLKELRKIATIESIGSSTRIEGSTMTDQEVKDLLNDVKITKLQNRDEQEVFGYYEVLELIYESYDNIQLSENYIKQLHQLLLKHSTKDERHRGAYKYLSNKVVATYPNGKQKTIFATTEPALVDAEMRELIEWTDLQLKQEAIHPLIIIGSFIYDFLSIHPFQDGNGRLSRLLTTLCLLQNDYSFIQYISFENHIEQNKKEYYEAINEWSKKTEG
ncbi:MAG: Fic family protein, partial [Chitinophagales bacterium]|nr:Fic family protein [Chitinophagales bacterium]